MANEQTNSNEYITQAVAKTARVAMQTMSAASTARTENAEPRMSGPIMKQPKFDRNPKDTFAELRIFKLEVKAFSKT